MMQFFQIDMFWLRNSLIVINLFWNLILDNFTPIQQIHIPEANISHENNFQNFSGFSAKIYNVHKFLLVKNSVIFNHSSSTDFQKRACPFKPLSR